MTTNDEEFEDEDEDEDEEDDNNEELEFNENTVSRYDVADATIHSG